MSCLFQSNHILIKQLGVLDFAIGSPRETLQMAFTNGIIDDDQWMQMLRTRNQLAHDYDGTFAEDKFQDIILVYYPLFEKIKESSVISSSFRRSLLQAAHLHQKYH